MSTTFLQNVDNKSNIQVSHKAHGPFFLVSFDRAYKIEQLLLYMVLENLKDKKDITNIVLKFEIFKKQNFTSFSDPTVLRR